MSSVEYGDVLMTIYMSTPTPLIAKENMLFYICEAQTPPHPQQKLDRPRTPNPLPAWLCPALELVVFLP
jgi:hypothetical protein